jgi:hypothetical protein
MYMGLDGGQSLQDRDTRVFQGGEFFVENSPFFE